MQMADFFRLLQEDHRLKLCPLYAPRTVPNAALMPISDYVTVLRNVSTQSGSRRYKYADGLVNVRLTAKGVALPGNTHVLTVYRTCKRTCSNVAWMETVSVDNIKARRVQILFTSFRAVHTEACVPPGAKGRSKQLIAQHVAVKELMRVALTRPSDVEAGVVGVHTRSVGGMNTKLLEVAGDIQVDMARHASKSLRKVGREGTGDFDVMHRIIQDALQRCVGSQGSLDVARACVDAILHLKYVKSF